MIATVPEKSSLTVLSTREMSWTTIRRKKEPCFPRSSRLAIMLWILSISSLLVPMRSDVGPFASLPKLLKLQVSFTPISRKVSSAPKS